jgi:hypothetical protein
LSGVFLAASRLRRSTRATRAARPPVELALAATSATVVMQAGHIVDLLD